MTALPVIVDCDPGHDDIFALWLALGTPTLDVRAVTTVGGNVPLPLTTFNARVALTVAGKTSVPIAAGAAEPLVRELETAEWIHGDNGLGGAELPEPTMMLDTRSALELMIDVLDSADEPVAIIATGPLTNVAILVRERPDLVALVREVVWMGGTTERGNATPYAEFNALVDPEALKIVLDSGVRFTMVGLNVTRHARLTKPVRDRISALGNNTSAFTTELMRFFCDTHENLFGLPDGPMHDPVAVAVLAAPETVTLLHTRLDVETTGTETAGATSVDLHGLLNREPNAYVAMSMDVDGFWDAVVKAIATLD